MTPFFRVSLDQIAQLVGEAVQPYPDVPASLVLAVVDHESSGGDVWAWNPEPRYRWFWDVRQNKPFRHADGRPVTDSEVASKIPPKDFRASAAGVDPDAEWWGQQASWGLMQIMGAVARERGFAGRFLNQLHDPALNIAFGVKHLAAYAKQYLGSYGWPGVLRAYNGGPYAVTHNSNPEYVEKIKQAHGGSLPGA